MANPIQERAIIHSRWKLPRTAVVHTYPETPWNDEVEYKFSLPHLAGYLFNKAFGQTHGEVKIAQETRIGDKVVE